MTIDLLGDCGRQAFGGGQQDGGGVHIVFGLCEHVGGDLARVAVGGDDQDFGGAGDEIDANFAGEDFLGRGDVDVAGADDAVRARDGRGAEGEGGDGLRAAHLEELARRRAGPRCRGLRGRAGTGHADVGNAGDLRGDDGHHQRGGQRIAAGGDVGGDGIERTDDLAECGGRAAASRAHSCGIWRSAKARMLAGGGFDGGAEFGGEGALGGARGLSRGRARTGR